MSIKEIKKDIEKYGYCEIQAGLFISDAELIISDQKSWADDDDAKHFDFTTSKFWVTTDNGVKPDGFDTLEEIVSDYELF